jgi:hypothetical protein
VQEGPRWALLRISNDTKDFTVLWQSGLQVWSMVDRAFGPFGLDLRGGRTYTVVVSLNRPIYGP